MKRLSSTDSLGALMSVCPTSEEHSPGNNHVYTREFPSALDGLDEEGCVEESGHISEKKRRLSVDQVKALEKNFEVENKLEPERKVKLAKELGLQPRQVAVWFQNRRARWKTKQLERDYGVLKANYDSLKHNYDALQIDNEALLKEVRELKSKLQEENIESSHSVKEEVMVSSENTEKAIEELPTEPRVETLAKFDANTTELNFENFDQNNINNNGVLAAASFFPDFKDGSSDSDSSAILNEENNSPNAAISSSAGVLVTNHHQFMPSSMNFFNFSSSSDSKTILGDAQKAYQPQFVKIEEHNFFSGDDSCNFFSDDQAPSLHWYCHDQWN